MTGCLSSFQPSQLLSFLRKMELLSHYVFSLSYLKRLQLDQGSWKVQRKVSGTQGSQNWLRAIRPIQGCCFHCFLFDLAMFPRRICSPWKALQVMQCEIYNKSSHPKMTASVMRGCSEERWLSLPNKYQRRWEPDCLGYCAHTLPQPNVTHSTQLASNSLHGIQVAALYIFFHWGFVQASKPEYTLHFRHPECLSLPDDIPIIKWPWLVKEECNSVPCPGYMSLVKGCWEIPR